MRDCSRDAGVVAALLFLTLAREAQAYLDPGTGAFVLQLLLAGLLGGLYALKVFWKNIRGFFSRVFSGRSQAAAGEDADEGGGEQKDGASEETEPRDREQQDDGAEKQ